MRNVTSSTGTSRSRSIRLDIDQNKARVLGVLVAGSRRASCNSSLSGVPRDLLPRARQADRSAAARRTATNARSIVAPAETWRCRRAIGQGVPLAQIADIAYGLEDGIIWRRDRLPTITVRARRRTAMRRGPTSRRRSTRKLDAIRARSCRSATASRSAARSRNRRKGQKSIDAGVPLFMLVVLTLLMIQLQQLLAHAAGGADGAAGLIGVTSLPARLRRALRLRRDAGHDRAVGHDHAQLGDPGRPDRAGHRRGPRAWDAIVDATVRRFRPIVLTAAAAILAMIPLTRSAFFGPMAVAIMGGPGARRC